MPTLPAATTAGGLCFAMPDVCLTPAAPSPVPVPYPNTGQWTTATGFVDKVAVEMRPVIAEGSKIPMSSGDEAGTNGGVSSGVNMKEIQPKTFSSTVVFGGKKAVMLTAVTAHNGPSANIPVGAHVAPSQTKVLIGP